MVHLAYKPKSQYVGCTKGYAVYMVSFSTLVKHVLPPAYVLSTLNVLTELTRLTLTWILTLVNLRIFWVF